MKKLLLLTAIIFMGMICNAQKTFFPTQPGTVLVYKTFDKKNKLTNTLRYTIKDVKVNGNDIDITYLVESTDPKQQQVFKDEITIRQKGDKLYMDMSNFVNKAAFQQNGEISSDVQITGNNMELPTNPKAGDVLPDANVEMAMKMGFVNMKMSADITNRKVVAAESITVKAGTFQAFKFTSDVNSVVMGMKMKSTNADWYALGVGIVKTETYDKNGNLQSYTELVELIK